MPDLYSGPAGGFESSHSARTIRDRQAVLDAAIDRASREPVARTGRRLVQVYDGGNMSACPDVFYLTHPVEADGIEAESATGGFLADTDKTVPVLMLGHAPFAGMVLVATAVGGRWVAEPPKEGPGCGCANSVCTIPFYNLDLAKGATHYPLAFSLADGGGYQWAYTVSGITYYQLFCHTPGCPDFGFEIPLANDGSGCSSCAGDTGIALTAHTCTPKDDFFSLTFLATGCGTYNGTWVVSDLQFRPGLCCSPCAIPKQDLSFTATTVNFGSVGGTLSVVDCGAGGWDSGRVALGTFAGVEQAIEILLDCQPDEYEFGFYAGQNVDTLVIRYYADGTLTAICTLRVDYDLTSFTCGDAFSLTWTVPALAGPCTTVKGVVTKLVITL